MSKQIQYRCNTCKVDICEHTRELDLRTQQDAAYFAPDIFERSDIYGEFLHESDFEKWQPRCYIKRGTEEYDKAVIEATREMLRAVWIRNRLTDFGSPEWSSLVIKENMLYKEFQFLQLMYERKFNKPCGYSNT